MKGKQMIEIEKSWKQLSSLPLDIQKEVVDFIAFLHEKYNTNIEPMEKHSEPIDKEPFIGMWQNRDDMNDSSAWVRNMKQNEWRK